MEADKNSFRRELGLRPKITSKCPPHVLSRSRSNHSATDPRNNIATRALETSSRTTDSGTQASTGQTGQQHLSDRSRAGSPVQHTLGHPGASRGKPGHPSNTLRVTRELTEANRVTRPIPVTTLKQHYTGQTGVGHRSDRSLATFLKIVQNLPSKSRWKSQAVRQMGTSEIRI